MRVRHYGEKGYPLVVIDDLTSADMPNYQLETVEVHFNRLGIYRSHILHGALFDDARLTTAPLNGV